MCKFQQPHVEGFLPLCAAFMRTLVSEYRAKSIKQFEITLSDLKEILKPTIYIFTEIYNGTESV